MGALEYPFPVAVKTGTSSRFRDAWTVAFTTRYLVGVWVGDPDFRPMNRISGYRSAAALAQRLLLRLHPDEAQGLHDLSFPPPRGHVPVRLCALTGAPRDGGLRPRGGRVAAPGRGAAPGLYGPPPAARGHAERKARHAPDPAGVRGAADVRRSRAALRGLGRVGWTAPTAGRRGALSSLCLVEPGVRVSFTSPADGLRLLRDPETPAGQATLSLAAVVDPPGADVVFYVDGGPFCDRGPALQDAVAPRPGRARLRGPGAPGPRRGPSRARPRGVTGVRGFRARGL